MKHKYIKRAFLNKAMPNTYLQYSKIVCMICMIHERYNTCTDDVDYTTELNTLHTIPHV